MKKELVLRLKVYEWLLEHLREYSSFCYALNSCPCNDNHDIVYFKELYEQKPITPYKYMEGFWFKPTLWNWLIDDNVKHYKFSQVGYNQRKEVLNKAIESVKLKLKEYE